ncbi:MAG TPA: N-acetyl-gamma-glutamyl-phosphate reductase [Streptosporangiaceae bacterium]
MRVAVAGASGYAGGELLRLLAGHPHLEIGVLTADSSAGKTVGEVHQHLAGATWPVGRGGPDGREASAGTAGLAGRVFEPHSALKEADLDLVFLALPSGASAPVAAELPDELAVVDLGADFRLTDPAAWGRHYGGAHAGRWVTGLPELPGIRPLIKEAKKVAAPGCYSTAAILALAPLAATGLIDTSDVVVVAASGTSGAGRSLKVDLLGSEVMGSVSAYQVAGAHRHTPEIEQALGELPGATGPARVSFTPLLVPMPRGILATCTAPLSSASIGTGALREALAGHYATEPFACVLAEGRWPATAGVAGSNGVHLQVAADHRAGRAVVVAAIDNLGKGAAGQAIQDANLMLGLPEAAGLTSIGVAP